MNSADYWKLFLDTGAPECYLAFHAARRREEANVSKNTGIGAPANGVQRS